MSMKCILLTLWCDSVAYKGLKVTNELHIGFESV